MTQICAFANKFVFATGGCERPNQCEDERQNNLAQFHNVRILKLKEILRVESWNHLAQAVSELHPPARWQSLCCQVKTSSWAANHAVITDASLLMRLG